MIQSGSITVSISNNTITRTSGSFLSEGFAVGNKITMYNSPHNTSAYVIKSLTATTITTNETLTDAVSNLVIII